MNRLEGRRVLLVVSGGIAAYKSAILVRRLRERGAEVDVVMTRAATQLIGPPTFEALSGRPVHGSLWDRPLAHVELGREADVAVVAPATANLIAHLALGLADDMATSTLLAAACPLLVCPAMNLRMWESPATRVNVDLLRSRGTRLLGPAHGELAEGEVGLGRMVEPDVIVAEVERLVQPVTRLTGRKTVVTAGPTRAPLDPVRYVGNRSSGRMGFALASAAWRRGADVTLIAGPTELPVPYGPRAVRVERSGEMLETLRTELADASVLLMAAAVSDFVVREPAARKIKKDSGGGLELRLTVGPDLLAETRALRSERRIVTLGFALESEPSVETARRKLEEKGLDLIALNEVGRPDAGFESDTNQVTLIDSTGAVEETPVLAKEELAERILDRLEAYLGD